MIRISSSLGRVSLLGLGILVFPAAGCFGEGPSQNVSLEENPQALAKNMIKIQVRGKSSAPEQFTGGQARLVAQRAAKIIALQKAEKRIVEMGGMAPIQSFRVLETHVLQDGSVEVVLEIIGQLKSVAD